MTYSVILFHSTNYAIWADRELDNAGIDHKLAPVPRHLSSDCGYCVKLATHDADRASQLLRERGIEFDAVYEV